MPVLDLPLNELEKYEGRNPKPNDFEAFWEEGIREVCAIDTNIEIRKAKDIEMKNFDVCDLYFDSTKHSRIYAKYVRPTNIKGKLPVIIMFHGLGANSRNFLDKVGLAAQGYIVLAMDCRGQRGKSEWRNGVQGSVQNGFIVLGFDDEDKTNMYYRNLFLDTVQIVRVAKSLPGADAENIYTYGGSQGGALALVCAALNPKVKKTVAIHPFLSDYKRVWEMDLAKTAYQDIAEYIKYYAPLLKDQDYIWEKLGYIDIQHFAERVHANVLWALSLADDVCPPSSQFATYNKIRSHKEMVIYTNHWHEELPGMMDRAATYFNKNA